MTEHSKESRDELLFALKTVMGDRTHGQHMTWTERCKIGRDAIDKADASDKGASQNL